MSQELTEHIKSQLDELELEYQDGAWERFLEKKDRRRGLFFWRKATVAAAVLALLSFFISGQFNSPIIKQAVKQQFNRSAAGTVVITNDRIYASGKSRQRYAGKTQALIAAQKPASLITAVTSEDQAEVMHEVPAVAISGQETLAAKPEEKKKMSFNELLAAESAQKQLAKPSAIGKWSFAVSVGQALDARSKADLSLGTHIAYALNSRLSLSSGILYNQLGGAKTTPLPEMSARSGKLLTGSQADLAGIDIPLELQISAGKQIYARVGVSAYAIFSQQQTLDYSEQKMMVTSYVDPTGAMHTETVTMTERSTESVPAERLRQQRLIGLYNLTVSFQQKISQRHTLSIEPYVKIPISSYSEQKLNLVQGGLRVKVGF